MAWENRLALDIMLAKKGGICIIIGIFCCTYISNNTTNRTITNTLQGLTTLSNELAENSGINDSFTNLMEKWVGRWKCWMISVLTFLVVVAGV
jgi:hypothetical protein